MSICFTFDCAIGCRLQQVSPARIFSQPHKRKHCINRGFQQTSSHEEENVVRPSTRRVIHYIPTGDVFQHRRKQCLQLYPKLGVVRSFDLGRLSYSPAPPRRCISSRANGKETQDSATYIVSREEVKGLVDEYPNPAKDEGFDQTSASRPVAWDKEGSTVSPIDGYVEASETKNGQRFERELHIALNDLNTSQRQLWEIYQRLPEPRAIFLRPKILARLLARLQTAEYKSTSGMLRFLALISDMKKSGLEVPLHAWNSAISYAGRCVKKITANEVESALRIWREMESVAGVSSNNVTFNILFDIATKARKFVLAEMILSEMATRRLQYNRYFRTGLIYYYGLRGSGNDVRRAYSELADAGEIVDTAVINCVIGALINCGETAAADILFERSKQLHASKTVVHLPPSHWRDKRRLGRTLNDAAEKEREEHERYGSSTSPAATNMSQIRERTSVAPDLTTYKIFIRQYAFVLGDIDRAAQLVDEMEQYGIAVHGSIFRYIFQAFEVHGGVLYTQWSRKRLENTWLAFVEALAANKARAQEIVEEEVDAEPEPREEKLASKQESNFFATNEDIKDQSIHSDDSEESRSEPFEQGVATAGTKIDRSVALNKHDNQLPDKLQRPMSDVIHPDGPEDLTQQRQELIETGQSFSQAERERDVYISRAMAELVGRAFARCTNLGRTAEVWAEIRIRWAAEVYDEVLDVEAEIAASFPGNEQLFKELVDRELQKTVRW